MDKLILKESWKYLLLILLISLPLFLHLDFLTIRLWDEGRVAVNAQEMYYNGNWLVPTYHGEPDLWNTKPPLMLWFQVFFMKLLGVNEWAIRLPSAFAALLTCVIIMLISLRYLKNFWFGFICVLVLVTSRGYLGYHTARTGDYDALLTLFLTLANLTFFIFLENSKTKFLYLFCLSMACAVLTKSAAAFMILPGLFIYVVLKRKLFFILKNKHLYICLAIFLVMTGGYYILREIYNPGYAKVILGDEFGRFFVTISEHKYSFWYYFGNLFDHRFIIWVFFVPFGIYFGLKNKDTGIKNLTLFSSIVVLTFFLVISSAQTKLFWYALPMYPFLAILAGVCVYHIFTTIKERKNLKHKALPYIVVALIFVAPYILIISSLKAKFPNHDYEVCNYLRNIAQGKIEKDDFFVLHEGTFFHGEFYINLLREQGKNIAVKNQWHIKTGDVVLISQEEVKKYLEGNYVYLSLEEGDGFGFYEVVEGK
jgi:4-amino-4-deoxy-L-arabinose transferase-like glycosyltransferase